MKFIQAAQYDYPGYLGEKNETIDDVFDVINTEFIKDRISIEYLYINPKFNFYSANLRDPEMMKIIYLAFVKQIPILTASTLKYKSSERSPYKDDTYDIFKYYLSKNSGEILSTMEIKGDGKIIKFILQYDKPSNPPQYIPSQPQYIPSQPQSTANAPVNVAKEKFPFRIIRNEPVTEDENQESMSLAIKLLKFIQSAPNNYPEYLGPIKGLDSIYNVINAPFIKYAVLHETIMVFKDANEYLADVNDPKMMKIIYLAFVKQIPILTASTLKYTSKLQYEGHHQTYSTCDYVLSTNSGDDFIQLSIDDDKKFNFSLNYQKPSKP